MARRTVKPLGFFEQLFFPLLKLSRRGLDRDELHRRLIVTERLRDHRKAERELQKQLKKEAKLYASIITNCWARLRQAHFTRHGDVSTEFKGHHGKIGKVQHVKFRQIYTTSERIYLHIGVNKKTLWGGTKDMLPFGVFVRDLCSDDTLFELGQACNRMVSASIQDARKGAWIIINRLEGFDGIPGRVSFADTLEHMPSDVSKAPVILGIGEHRKVHMVDLASHPHWLVGGSSGGGKSNIINHIICSLMRYSEADELKFILIDLKQMEFGFYENAPHLLRPVVFEAEEAVEVLEGLVKEVQRRANLMRNRAKELSAWNKQYPANKLPRLVVIIDEFAELMLASGNDVSKEIERLTTRITNLGRAVGIHVILATQRPAVKVIPNAIKINMPLIVSARVPNYHQSNVILGSGEAASLPMLPGRMIYLSGSTMQTIQTPYISDDDVIASVRIARGRALGFIRLVDNEPVVCPDYIVCYIVDCLAGTLSPEKLWTFFRDYGVPSSGLKALLAEILKKGSITAFGRVFQVEKNGNSWRLIELVMYRPPSQDFEINLDTTVARLLAPRPLLLGPGPMAEPEAKPEPVIIEAEVVPEEKTFDDILTEFIAEYCTVGKTSTATARELQDALAWYCEQRGIEMVSRVRFGKAMKARGFKKFTTSDHQVAYRGIGLISVQEPLAA